MNTRLATAAFPGSERPAGPLYRSIIAVDLEGSTKRTNLVKGELRRIIYDLLWRSLEAVAVTDHHLEQLVDRGDGVLVLIRAHDDVPKTVLLDRFVPLLTTLVGDYNTQIMEPALRIGLRAVVHAGEIHADSRGFYGEAIDLAIRLLDSRPVKKVLRQTASPLVLVISDEIHSGIVRQGYVGADVYRPMVRVNVGNRQHRGWVHVPDARTAPIIGSLEAGYRSVSVLGSRHRRPNQTIAEREAVASGEPEASNAAAALRCNVGSDADLADASQAGSEVTISNCDDAGELTGLEPSSARDGVRRVANVSGPNGDRRSEAAAV
jgi:hypothetical protein